jgi:OOP family OmpA-OmpF porin
MKKLLLIATLVGAIILTGALISNVVAVDIFTEEDFKQKIVKKEYFVKTADNFIILFDTSSSMADSFKKGSSQTQYEVALELLRRGNMRLPDLGYNGSLYQFTPNKFVYPMGPYDRAKFAQAIDSLPAEPKGPTLLAKGLLEIEPVLDKLSGKTAVFIFTDGTYSSTQGLGPEALLARMAEKHDVCFYIISDAKGHRAEKTVTDMAKANACSRVIPFDIFVQNPNYYTGALYLVKSGTEVVTWTETKLAGVRIDNILFEFNKVDIQPVFHSELDELGQFLQNNPSAYAVLAGFTCNIGSPEVNYEVSYLRVQSVANYLKENFNISRERIVGSWYGLINPVASNNEPKGRALNRRVEIAIGGL